MKKTYESPELHVEQFDVEDVITVSLVTVGGGKEGNEFPIDLGGLSSAPGTD